MAPSPTTVALAWTVFLLGCSLVLGAGYNFKFDITPQEVVTTQTEMLTLRCGLEDEVGRQNDLSVTSIVIIKHTTDTDGKPTKKYLASASALGLDRRANGYRSSYNFSGGQAFLEVRLAYPTREDAGNHYCEVNAVNPYGHIKKFSQMSLIRARNPVLSDIINQVHEIQKTRLSIKSELEQVKHIEKSSAYCSAEEFVPSLTPKLYQIQLINVTFSKPYIHPPTVYYGLTRVHETKHIGFWIHVGTIHEDGFQIECIKYTDSKVEDLLIEWVSFPVIYGNFVQF